MKKSVTTFIGIILAAITFTAEAQDQSLLWKITGNGLKNPSYLFGTIHIMCGDYVLDEKVTTAITDTEQIYLEIDMDDPALAGKMQKLVINKDMKNFSDELDEDEKKKLNDFLIEHYNAGLEQFGVLKPFALMSMILVKRISCESAKGMEDLIQSAAQKDNKEIKGLETVEFQMGLFDSVPLEDQMVWIMDLLEDDYPDDYDDLMTAYINEDLDQLELLMAESPGMENYLEMLLYKRNKNWVPLISQISKAKSTFYAVGAGHLTGDQGVVSLLKAEGFTVEPIN
ncbi:MAG: TraB/GumN family protein [Flammeovirgaceae bacterium]|nr:TraB/GumN family protein [Flammeovirgaceae bacterium]|tara:strand:- start:1841 stop:2692 length:852 start_codon:yes stop_codon:yes gene_type:complete